MSGILLVKLGTSLVVFFVCLVGAIVPLRLVSKQGGGGGGGGSYVQKALSYGNCFGGGVLLGVALVHLLVDSESSSDENGSSGSDVSAGVIVEKAHRLPHLLAAVGFLLAFILERVLFAHSHDHNLEGVHHTEDDDRSSVELHQIASDSNSSTEDDLEGHKLVPSVKLEDDPAATNAIGEHTDTHRHSTEEEEEEEGSHIHHGGEHKHNSHKHGHNHHSDAGHLHHAEHHQHGHSHGSGHASQAPPLPYLLYSVLALESVVTGSALGIQESESKVWVTFFAIVTHIWAEAFTLTINLLKSKFSPKKVRWLMVLFSAITPGSSFVGVLLNRYLATGLVVVFSQVLVAVAAGIFLYVAIIEIMVEEFHSQDNKWEKLTLLLLGFVFISLVGWLMG